MKNFAIIAALDANMGIARGDTVPWYLPEDLENFAKITKNTENPSFKNALIMDLDGWNILPSLARPLEGRINVVISTDEDLDLPDDVLQFINLEDALTALDTSRIIENVFVLGGVSLYEEAILHPNLERMYLTRIEEDFDCDTFFPDQIPDEFEVVASTEILSNDELEYSFVVLERGEAEFEINLES